MNGSYDTVTEALDALKAEGYSADFNLRPDCLEHSGGTLHPGQFVIDAIFRFDDNTDPDDEAIIYAVRSLDDGTKGTVVSAYGMYEELEAGMIEAMRAGS